MGDDTYGPQPMPPGYRIGGQVIGRKRMYYRDREGRLGWVPIRRFLIPDNVVFLWEEDVKNERKENG